MSAGHQIIIFDEPSRMMKSCCRVGVAGKMRSSIFARLNSRWLFLRPCWDVCQAAWDASSYYWIVWLKWMPELCVINSRIWLENPCACIIGPSDVVYMVKNWYLRKPCVQLIFFGYLSSPGNHERSTCEIGFKPVERRSSDGRQDNLLIPSINSGR